MEIPDRILIVGLGKTGVSVARFLGGQGKAITVTDTKTEAELSHAIAELKGVEFKGRFGGHNMDDFINQDMIVVSPGVDIEMPYIKEAVKRGIRVIGEIELASAFVDSPIIAITGTNGKTTVTSLMGEIFQAAFEYVFVGGNIGNPLVNYVMDDKKADYVILEISSFQLETIHRFHPHISVLLNITEDHLDRYRSFDEYRDAKLRIFENQSGDDFAILNKNIELNRPIKAKKLYFSAYDVVEEGAYYRDNKMYIRFNGKEYTYRRDISPLPGTHNTENLLVVLLAAHIAGIERGVIEEVLKGFMGLPHRVEYVREINGVRFINDSKATNVDATKRALQGINDNIVLIAGGKDKGGSYRVMMDELKKVKALILIGEARKRIIGELAGHVVIYEAADLDDAVKRAMDVAKKGDTVLFSPMCSSFDMFRDYKERGEIFKKIVGAI
ncbi:MAG TPA: UDP-N-acetylmuramoyl-L-alanine--D-glutamate ligase [Syntrophorhabdaceae bacterium]|nr:UDP-N-acetylmuramoyl-L-alanine--D-glutamate ligase [Syntrophorhabdaceae bacterium]